MNSYSDYHAKVGVTKVEDITSCKRNQQILRQLKNNDPQFTDLLLTSDCDADDEGVYDPAADGSIDLGWLGYFIANNTQLKILRVRADEIDNFNDIVSHFCRNVNHNRSIQKIYFDGLDGGGEILRLMSPFFKNNYSLNGIELIYCNLEAKGLRSLSLAVAGCGGTLKCFKLTNRKQNNVSDSLVDVIVALSMHPHLEELIIDGEMWDVDLDKKECIALATLLEWSMTKLQSLNLYGCGIGIHSPNVFPTLTNMPLHTLDLQHNVISDEGMEILTRSLHNSHIVSLNLSRNNQNGSITNKGWKTFFSLLQNPSSRLEILQLDECNLGDEECIILANALANNKTLTLLKVENNDITPKGLEAFSKLLCDTSSVNDTSLSNHTLYEMSWNAYKLEPLLDLNRLVNKNIIAFIKVLISHDHFDMQPFFEWDLKVLHHVVGWFERAAACIDVFDASRNGEMGDWFKKAATLINKCEPNLGQRKLSSIYQFIRSMPLLYVEACTRKEIAKIRSSAMKFQGKQLKLQLEVASQELEVSSKLQELEECETRANARL